MYKLFLFLFFFFLNNIYSFTIEDVSCDLYKFCNEDSRKKFKQSECFSQWFKDIFSNCLTDVSNLKNYIETVLDVIKFEDRNWILLETNNFNNSFELNFLQALAYQLYDGYPTICKFLIREISIRQIAISGEQFFPDLSEILKSGVKEVRTFIVRIVSQI